MGDFVAVDGVRSCFWCVDGSGGSCFVVWLLGLGRSVFFAVVLGVDESSRASPKGPVSAVASVRRTVIGDMSVTSTVTIVMNSSVVFDGLAGTVAGWAKSSLNSSVSVVVSLASTSAESWFELEVVSSSVSVARSSVVLGMS